jgi:hypothetical protein
MGGITDFLKGDEVTYKRDSLMPILNREAATGMKHFIKKGAMNLNNMFYGRAPDFAKEQIGLENKLLRESTNDAVRKTRDLMAARGMGNSSIGMGAEINAQRNLNDKIALNNASAGNRVMDLYKERIGIGERLMAPKLGTQFRTETTKTRQGGMASLVGAGLGYLATGSPEGAKVGMSVGQAYQNS